MLFNCEVHLRSHRKAILRLYNITSFGRWQYQETPDEEGKRYVLKNLEYDPVHRLDLFLLPCPEAELETYLGKLRRDGSAICGRRPWQLQRFAEGSEFTAFAVLRGGAVRALTTAASSASQLNYEHLHVEEIDHWCDGV